MTDLISAIQDILGDTEFYVRLGGSTSNYTWDYGAMLEYACGTIILGICIVQVFKFLRALVT